jgi:hypothetical protein
VNPDNELELWRQQWQTQATVPVDLRQTIDRQTRQMRLLMVAEVAVTIIFGGGSLLASLTLRRSDVTVLTAGIWVFIAIAWAFSQANRRGLWRPAAATTAAYLDLVILRARRRLQAVSFTSISYIVFLSFNLGWVYQELARHGGTGLWAFLTSGPVFIVWALTALLALVAIWHRRRITAQLNNLAELRRELGDETRT